MILWITYDYLQGKKTAVLVSQLLSTSHDREGTKQLEIFSLQLLHRPLEFSACGLFTLDRTLVTSVNKFFTLLSCMPKLWRLRIKNHKKIFLDCWRSHNVSRNTLTVPKRGRFKGQFWQHVEECHANPEERDISQYYSGKVRPIN